MVGRKYWVYQCVFPLLACTGAPPPSLLKPPTNSTISSTPASTLPAHRAGRRRQGDHRVARGKPDPHRGGLRRRGYELRRGDGCHGHAGTTRPHETAVGGVRRRNPLDRKSDWLDSDSFCFIWEPRAFQHRRWFLSEQRLCSEGAPIQSSRRYTRAYLPSLSSSSSSSRLRQPCEAALYWPRG